MIAVTTDPGELLFERYLVQQGYEILDQQRDFGTGKAGLPDPSCWPRAIGGGQVVQHAAHALVKSERFCACA
jgi:hypothetical protein